MQWIKSIVVIVFTSLVVNFWTSTADSVGVHTCNLEERNVTVLAYVDWPFRVDCDHLRQAWDALNPGLARNITKCRLSRNGTEVSEGLFTLASLGDNVVFRAELLVNGTRCLAGSIDVDLSPFPNETCLTSLGDANKLKYLQSAMGDYVELGCGVRNGAYPDVIPKGANESDFTTTWISDNCRTASYRHNKQWNHAPISSRPAGYGDTLEMPSVDFYDAINLTCRVRYKDKTLYPVSYSQCVRQSVVEGRPTLTCVERYDVGMSGRTRFDCSGQTTGGLTKHGEFMMQWKKDDAIVCENRLFEIADPGAKDRFSCLSHDTTGNESYSCVYNKDVSNADIEDKRKRLKITLDIGDVHADDFGNYQAVLWTVVNGRWKNDTWAVVLLEDRTAYYMKLVKVLSGLLAVIILVTAVCVLVRVYWIYILVAYKRSQLWKYDKDDKDYVAYLSYLYDKGDDDESAAADNAATLRIVQAIGKYMEGNDYSYYDEQKQSSFSAEVENVTNLVERCHRMILVVTPKYLEDRWRRFHAELGFHGLLESRMGLIVILTPGARKCLEKKAKNDKVWGKLSVALKTNRVVKWHDGMDDGKLTRHLEYGLPKLMEKARGEHDNPHFRYELKYQQELI